MKNWVRILLIVVGSWLFGILSGTESTGENVGILIALSMMIILIFVNARIESLKKINE